MPVLVTGGTGFVGGHLVDALVAAGRDTHIVDRHSTQDGRYVNPNATLHLADIVSPDVKQIIADISPSVIYHLAAQVSVPHSAADPINDANANIIGSLNLLEGARQMADPPRFVFVSTGGAIYGDVGESARAYEHMQCKPISPYGASKLAVESYLRVYHNICGLRYAIVRPGNVYGPRQTPRGGAGVVAIFTKAMLANEPVTIFGDGSAVRDYVFIDDLVGGILTAGNQYNPGPFNLSSGEPTSVLDVFNAIRRRTSYRRKPEFADERASDVQGIVLDVSRARKEFGWTPSTSFTEGIGITVQSFEDSRR